MCLECIGVVSGCCCKEAYRYPHNNYYFPTPIVLALFWQQHPYFFVHFLNVSSFLFVIFVQYTKRCSKNIQHLSKIEIT